MLYRKIARGRWVIVVGLGLFPACGGRAVQSGVDPNKRANDLTADEYRRVCDELANELAEANSAQIQHDLACRATGFLAGAVVAGVNGSIESIRDTCVRSYDECLMGEPAPTTIPRALACEQMSTTCEATVEEIETCGNDLVAWFANVRAIFPSCNELTTASFGDNAQGTALPAAPASYGLVQACAE